MAYSANQKKALNIALVNKSLLDNLKTDLDAVDTLSSTETGYIDGVTAGTAAASKAVVLDANKDVGDLRNLDCQNLDCGLSGTAGSVDIFPSTASKGKLAITCADQTGNTTVTLNANAMGQATQINLADPGIAAAYVPMSTAQITVAEMDILDGATVTTAEVNLLDGSSSANSTASVAAILDANKKLQTNANVGTANTGTTAVEYGDGHVHTTVLTVSTALGAIAGGADLGLGKLLYTLPAGACIIDSAYMSMALDESDGNITADTPDVGLGTVVASGVVNVLGGTATFENIITGQTAADCNGTASVKTTIPTAAVPLVIESGDAHTIYFNCADGWAAGGETACGIAGTVVINWRFMA